MMKSFGEFVENPRRRSDVAVPATVHFAVLFVKPAALIRKA
jgi:hypothetical protein